MNVEKLVNVFMDYDLFTEKEIHLVTCINGFNIDTLNDMLYARYGYNDVTQMLDEV